VYQFYVFMKIRRSKWPATSRHSLTLNTMKPLNQDCNIPFMVLIGNMWVLIFVNV